MLLMEINQFVNKDKNKAQDSGQLSEVQLGIRKTSVNVKSGNIKPTTRIG